MKNKIAVFVISILLSVFCITLMQGLIAYKKSIEIRCNALETSAVMNPEAYPSYCN